MDMGRLLKTFWEGFFFLWLMRLGTYTIIPCLKNLFTSYNRNKVTACTAKKFHTRVPGPDISIWDKDGGAMGGLAIGLCDTLGKILEIRTPYPQREEEEYDE